MKTLTLLRHAKSSWGVPSQRDFDRPLNPRGEKAARAMGRELRRLGIVFDSVLASPAARVVGTIAGLREVGCPIAPDYDQRIYLAPARTLLGIVRAADDSHERLLIVGHNPGMEQLALLLAGGGALREQVATKYPTGALAEIRFDVPGWRDVEEGAGALERFIRPRDLDPALGPGRD
ncbi:MAG TPA: histidine phosphatase family protein [Allosphingosinicella sp.]|nr:histidine phosphatase family protein [Allosphingosinicella sp.]